MIFKIVAVLLILHATCGTYHTATAKVSVNVVGKLSDLIEIFDFRDIFLWLI